MSESDRQWWYAGLPATGERRLTDDERADLRALSNERLRSSGVAVAWLIVLAGIIAASFIWPLISIAIVMGAYFLALLMSRRYPIVSSIRQVLAVRADLRAGMVVQCSGQVGELVVSRSRLLGDASASEFLRASDAAITIEVLPRSQTLWTCDGQRPYNHVIVPKSSTAPAPEHARLAANFVKSIREGIAAHQRALSPDEMHELEGYAPAIQPARYVLTIVLIVGAIAAFRAAMVQETDSLLLFAALAITAFITGIQLVRAFRWRRKIAPDLAEGRVVIVRAETPEGLGKPHEFLMYSGIPWTIDNAPAAWRRLVR